MQSWPQGQNGGDDNHAWQQNFNFAAQNGQFDRDQAWSQPLADQNAYARAIDPAEAAGFLPDPQALMPGYQEGHGSFDMANQYNSQDVLDSAFSSLPPDLYAQQNKLDLGGANIHHMGQFQAPSHAHQGFPVDDFAAQFQQPHQSEQPQAHVPQQQRPQHQQHQPQHQYSGATPQYSQAQLMQQQAARQESHTPVQQQFGGIQPNYGQPQLQQTHTPPVQHAQPYLDATFAAQAAAPQVNGQQHAYQPAQEPNHAAYQQQTPATFAQAPYTTTDAFEYQQSQTAANPLFQPAVQQQQQQQQPQQQRQQQHHQQHHQQQMQLQQSEFRGQPPLSNVPSQNGTPQPQHATPLERPAVPSPVPEGPAKKRQRITKPAAASPVPEPMQSIGSPIEPTGKRIEELDSLVAPTPTPEEGQILQQFQKRKKSAQPKFPPIKGLPHLAYENTVKLPAPKSYDKLAPLVAVPSRSKKPIVPEFGYDIPCEIQGKFTSQYSPAFDKIGLEKRRVEAKPLLDDFDKSMKSLGKKRPKYTEYPHSFKEQLKSDEASKNKAEKKAKKEQEEERNRSLRSDVRPNDPVDAAAWDAMRIVHFDDSVTKTNAFVAGRVQQAGDFFIKLRGEMNQTKQEYDQGVKEGLPADKLAALKKDMDIKRESLHRALDATIEHADDAIMDNLGGHQKLVLSLVNVLIASIKAADYGGKLPKIVLEFFTLVPMTKKIADTPNFETVRKRFADKGDDEAKDLAREIAVKVKKALKAAEPETATGYQGTSAASRAKAAAAKAAAAQSSTKRGREDDSSADSRTVKKVAVESGGSSLSKKLAQPKIQLQSASKVPGGARSNASILGDKSRAATKPASRQEPIASVEGGSADGRKSSGSKPEVKPPAPKMGAPPSSSALSGIASLLDSINAPRAETPPAPAKETRDSETPETDEQRTKRLRKKSRRKLRVSWKPEAELVQVKVFEKEDDENEGRDMNMIRDAADDKSEGMVLKQRADAEGEGEGDEDEDEYEPDQPWTPPTEMDFSNLDKYRRDANFVTRGGNLTFSTPEQERIAQREQRELMAIYTDINDIPPTPKSPPPQTEPRQVDAKIGTLPQEPRFEEVWARWRDEQQLSLDGALYAATQRLSAKASPPNALEAIVGRISGQAQGKGGDDVNVPLVRGPTAADQAVAWLKSEKATKWRDPKPAQTDLSRPYKYRDAGTQAIGAAVEIVARALAGKAFPATEPPAWLANDDERVREWWVAYNKASAGKDKRTEEERAKHEGAAKMQDWTAYYTQQQQAYAPYMAILQQLNGGGQPAAQQPQPQPQDSQLQAILAAMGQPAQQQAAMPSYNPNDPSYQQLLMLAQMAQQGQQPPQQPTAQQQPHGRDSNGPENDRYDDSMYDDYDPSESYHNGGGGGGGGGGGRGHRDNGKKKNKPGPSSIHKPPNAALIGTKPCTFWQQGKCARGDKCTFRHD